MKNKNNEIFNLNEEFKYNRNYFKKFNINLEKINIKAKKIILKNLFKILNNKKIDFQIQKETLEFIKKNIKTSKKLNDIKSIENFKLIKTFENLKQLKDLKKGFQYPILWRQTNNLLNKELILLKKKKLKLKEKISKLKEKEKRNYFKNFFLKKYEINLIKNNIRIKDVNSLIKNKAIYRKLYLSDEIPLTPLGWIKLLISYGFLIFWALIILWPLGELVKATLNDRAINYLNVGVYEFGFNSFERLFDNTNYLLWMQNTIYVSVITSICTIFSALFMGYAFSRFRFKGRKSSLLSVMLLQMIPTLSALTVFYVLYTVLKQNYAISGLTILIFIYIGGGVAGNTFIMKGYMDSISIDIDEAAKIDGLSQWKIFVKIIMPLTKPMIALVGLWSFIGPFGDYILPGLLLTKDEDFTLARGIRILITNQQKLDQSAFAAGALLVAIPISIFFILLRNFLIGGITAGGVKG